MKGQSCVVWNLAMSHLLTRCRKEGEGELGTLPQGIKDVGEHICFRTTRVSPLLAIIIISDTQM
jgi:hypothetical protein